MFKIVVVIVATTLAGGQGRGSFESRETYETLKECEQVRERAVPALIEALRQQTPDAEFSADSECEVATGGVDPYDRLSDILSEMNRRGGFGVTRP